MASSDLRGTTALVTGASRGFGRATAVALLEAGARVVSVSRTTGGLAELQAEHGEALTVVSGDATDPVLAGELIDTYRPHTLVLNAGAAPLSRPIQHHTWQTFSRNWEVDVQHAFHWIREALLVPLQSGSTVIVMSSGAALVGSPLSGGYAGRESHAAIDDDVRSRGVRPGATRHPVLLDSAEADAGDRPRRCCRHRVRQTLRRR